MTDNDHTSHLDKYFCRTQEQQRPPAEDEQDTSYRQSGYSAGFAECVRRRPMSRSPASGRPDFGIQPIRRLDRAEFDPSEGITLHFGSKTVKIVWPQPQLGASSECAAIQWPCSPTHTVDSSGG